MPRAFEKKQGRPTSDSGMVELNLHYHMENDRAYCVSENGDLDCRVWLPKSECGEVEIRERKKSIVIEVPEWLAKDRGLI
jgi:hypothetical protein